MAKMSQRWVHCPGRAARSGNGAADRKERNGQNDTTAAAPAERAAPAAEKSSSGTDVLHRSGIRSGRISFEETTTGPKLYRGSRIGRRVSQSNLARPRQNRLSNRQRKPRRGERWGTLTAGFTWSLIKAESGFSSARITCQSRAREWLICRMCGRRFRPAHAVRATAPNDASDELAANLPGSEHTA